MSYTLDLDAVPRLELYELAYITFLQAHLAEALAGEHDFWLGYTGVDLALPMPAPSEWHQGNIPPDALAFVVAQLPAVTVEAVNLTPGRDDLLAAIDAVQVHVYTEGQTPDQATQLNHRYSHALAAVCASGWPQGLPDPIKGVGRLAVNVAETEVVGRASYVKGGRVVVPLLIAAQL